MKPLLFTALGICLATTGCYADQPTSKVLLAQAASSANASKIAQVKAGTLETAHASWWGFNKSDATACLQEAINSGVSKLIVDNTGSDWIIGSTINLASDQQIIFEDGVVIQAKKGAFKGKQESLFSGDTLTNVSLIGQGKVLFRMRQEDYDNPKLYEKAEWRHGINLRDCKNVILRNITVTKTGGDGLYLGAGSHGYNENILVENMVFDANYRQGISVISAENLTIRNCKLLNTKGTAPQSGIDFEPNHQRQRLVNITLDNCLFAGNAGAGVEIATFHLSHKLQPISITIKNSKIIGNTKGLMVNPFNLPSTEPLKGKVVIDNCEFVDNVIYLGDPVEAGIHYQIKDSTLDFRGLDSKKSSWQSSPVVFAYEDLLEGCSIGDVTFDDVVVLAQKDIDPIFISYNNGATISDSINGEITLKVQGQDAKYDLTKFIHQKQQEFSQYNSLKLASVDIGALHAPGNSKPRVGNKTFYLRNKFTFLQYAKQGETITITIRPKRIRNRETLVDLIAPDGNKIKTYTVPFENKPVPITFTAAQTGIYRLVRTQKFSQYIDITSAHPGNGLLLEQPVDFLPQSGSLYFEVPAGVEKFQIGVGTSTSADVSLINQAGEVVEAVDNLRSLHVFSTNRKDASRSEIWSIKVSDAVWAVTVSMYQPLVPIVSTNPSTLLRK